MMMMMIPPATALQIIGILEALLGSGSGVEATKTHTVEQWVDELQFHCQLHCSAAT